MIDEDDDTQMWEDRAALRKNSSFFTHGRRAAFYEIAEKVKEMPWESDTKDSFLVWLQEQSTGA